jgi:hypothetical protein
VLGGAIRAAVFGLAALLLAGTLPAAARAAEPAVARPSFRHGGHLVERGLVFFLAAPGAAVEVAAVGTGHNFDLRQLAEASAVVFQLGHSRRRVASSLGLLAPPGLPFSVPGGTLRGDFAVYALEAPPEGARVLAAEFGPPPAPGHRVRLLGIPPGAAQDEDEVFGQIVDVTRDRIDIDLDVPYDLRHWGGAPVLSSRSGRVIGMLQAHDPRAATHRVNASPIDGVLAALGKPLDAGAGRPFARFAEEAAARPAPPMPPPGPSPGTPPAPRRADPAPRAPTEPLIRQTPSQATRVKLEVEHPVDGAVVGRNVCGAFVAGRALALHGELRKFDVALVIDTSGSTIESSGADINGNGIVGQPRLGPLGAVFLGHTDRGDSILAAEVAAARQLLRGLDPRSTRVAVVTFAGDEAASGGGLWGRPPPPPALTLAPLTDDYGRIERALNEILQWEPAGLTHMAAGVDQAWIELRGLRGALSEPDPRSEKVMLFFTDGQPTLPYGVHFETDNVRAVLRAASRARRARVRIHSFAIGPKALEGPIAAVEMAARTDGYFTPVRHPGDLVDVVEQVSFANLDEVRVRSLTTGEEAKPFRSSADGSWGGFVKIEPGKNRIEIRARAADGTEASRVLEVRVEPEAESPPIPKDLVVQRNRLLEECLRDVKRVRLTAEEERAEQIRKELMVEIERERAQALERAAEQRKKLEIDVEEEP